MSVQILPIMQGVNWKSWLVCYGLLLGTSAAQAEIYHVKSGETLGGIARRAGVSLSQLRQANNLHGEHIQVGQALHLPAVYRPATTYTVQSGDTLSSISAHYHLSVQALVQANAGWHTRKRLPLGQALYIPARRAHGGRSGAADDTPSAHIPSGPGSKPSRPSRWRWPVRGWVSSGFGERTLENREAMHYGIDIVVPIGTAVHATRSGHVIESRPDFARGWGWTIILDHGDGWHTRYAHLSQNLVQVGEVVTRGQIIARSGNTGRSTGPHLHFGTYLHMVPKDPLTLLP